MTTDNFMQEIVTTRVRSAQLIITTDFLFDFESAQHGNSVLPPLFMALAAMHSGVACRAQRDQVFF